jgi:hypothetical protein
MGCAQPDAQSPTYHVGELLRAPFEVLRLLQQVAHVLQVRLGR